MKKVANFTEMMKTGGEMSFEIKNCDFGFHCGKFEMLMRHPRGDTLKAIVHAGVKLEFCGSV